MDKGRWDDEEAPVAPPMDRIARAAEIAALTYVAKAWALPKQRIRLDALVESRVREIEKEKPC